MLSQCCFNYGFLPITRLKRALKFPQLSELPDSLWLLKASFYSYTELVKSIKIVNFLYFIPSTIFIISSVILKTYFEMLFNDKCACVNDPQRMPCFNKALDKFLSNPSGDDYTVLFLLINKQVQQNNFDFFLLPHSNLYLSYHND